MSNFRRGQQLAHIKKKNMVMATLIVVLLINLFIQIWLIYTALNNALTENKKVAIACFVSSFIIFVASAVWLNYLPQKHKETN